MTLLRDTPYYYYKPVNASEGIQYILEPVGHYTEPSFVMVPYVHPAHKEISPQFYAVREQIHVTLPSAEKACSVRGVVSQVSKAEYLRNVALLKQHIQRGDIYEINFCIRFSYTEVDLDPVSVSRLLHAATGAPYAALVRLRDEVIISASPELFLKKEGSRLVTKPMKGTARRDADPGKDARNKLALEQSLKERTENVMAVDVSRNDLSIVATKGSVKVEKLFGVESFLNVHQMVTTVACELKAGVTFNEILQATFPMASMTGAPKTSAMNIIDKAEGFDRNYYSGAMGLIDAYGDFELSVNIRTIFYSLTDKKMWFAVGGAITHQCDPESEYSECLLKASSLLKAIGQLES